jgi:hypothetical protein
MDRDQFYVYFITRVDNCELLKIEIELQHARAYVQSFNRIAGREAVTVRSAVAELKTQSELVPT